MPTAAGLRRIGTHRRRTSIARTPLSLMLAVALILANLLVLAPVAAQSESTEPFATAGLVPADSLLYSVVPLANNEDQWQQGMALLGRAGLGDELDAMAAELLGAEDDAATAVELFLGGEIAMVVTETAVELLANEASGTTDSSADSGLTESGLAFLITADSPAFISLALESAIESTADELGVDVEQTEYEGVSIKYVSVPDGVDQTPMATARIGNVVIAAGFPADLEPLIETSNGDREALTDLASFGEVRAALDQEYLLFGYLNPPPMEIIEQTMSQAGLRFEAPETGLAPSGFLIAADEPGLRIETVTLGTGSATASTTNLADSRLVTTTPHDALVLFSGLDLAGTGILDLLASFVIEASGLVAPSTTPGTLDDILVDQFEQLARIIGVNFRTDLLLQLTGAYGFWVEYDPATEAVTTLFASEVNDVEAVSGALFQVTILAQSAGSGQMTVTTRPVGETDRVFSILTGDPTIPRVEYGFLGETMVVGLGDAVDAYAEGPESPLATSDSFEVIMDSLPEATTGLLYIDLEQAIPLLSAAADETGVDDMAAELTGAADETTPAAQPNTSGEGDAHPDCAQFGSQEEAQDAYDAFAPGTFQLDEDFDGEACEDFFTQAPEPVVTASPVADLTVTEMPSFSAYGMVAFDEDGNSRTSSLLLVTEPDE